MHNWRHSDGPRPILFYFLFKKDGPGGDPGASPTALLSPVLLCRAVPCRARGGDTRPCARTCMDRDRCTDAVSKLTAPRLRSDHAGQVAGGGTRGDDLAEQGRGPVPRLRPEHPGGRHLPGRRSGANTAPPPPPPPPPLNDGGDRCGATCCSSPFQTALKHFDSHADAISRVLVCSPARHLCGQRLLLQVPRLHQS